MDLTSISELSAHAIACGIDPTESSGLARKVMQAVSDYHANSKKGAYDENGVLQEEVFYGEVIAQQKNQRRLKSLTYPTPVIGRPANPALKVLISNLAAAFTHAEGSVTLNREEISPSPFHLFVEPICNELGLFKVRDYISDHMKARKTL